MKKRLNEHKCQDNTDVRMLRVFKAVILIMFQEVRANTLEIKGNRQSTSGRGKKCKEKPNEILELKNTVTTFMGWMGSVVECR